MKKVFVWIKEMSIKVITNLWTTIIIFVILTLILSVLDSKYNGWKLFSWFELLVTLASSFALPLTVIIVATIFKKPIFELLNRTKKISSKYFDSEFVDIDVEVSTKEVDEFTGKLNKEVSSISLYSDDDSKYLQLFGELVTYVPLMESKVRDSMSENPNILKFLYMKQLKTKMNTDINIRNNYVGRNNYLRDRERRLLMHRESFQEFTDITDNPNIWLENLADIKVSITRRGFEEILSNLEGDIWTDFELFWKLSLKVSNLGRYIPMRSTSQQQMTRNLNNLKELLKDFSPGAIKLGCESLESEIINRIDNFCFVNIED